MGNLFQETNAIDTSGLDFSEQPSEGVNKVSPEAVTMALIEDGHDIGTAMLADHRYLTNSAAISGGIALAGYKQKATKRDTDRVRQKYDGNVETPEDIENYGKELNAKGIYQDKDWKVSQGEGSLLYQRFEAIANEDPEYAERLNNTLKDLSGTLSVQHELNNARMMMDKTYEEASRGEVMGSLMASLVPFGDFITLHNIAKEVFPAMNTMGIGLSSDVINEFGEQYRSLSQEDQKEATKRLLEAGYHRQSVLGFKENVLANHWSTGVLINTIEESRVEGSGFLGMKNLTDAGLNTMEILDLLAARDLAYLGGLLFKRFFGMKKGLPVSDTAYDFFDSKAREAGITPKPSPEFNPALDVKTSTGSLMDSLTLSNHKAVGKIIDDTPIDKADEMLAAVGVDMVGFVERMTPNMTGAIDPTALPPSAYSPRLSAFMRGMKHNSNLNMLGFTEERGTILTKYMEDFISISEGYGHYSRSYFKPPAKGDTESLGTVFTRYGATPDEGFTDMNQIIVLMNNMKANGLSVNAINTEAGVFVETASTHVLSGKDATQWSTVDGTQLTIAHSYGKRAVLPWSESVLIDETLHPQRIASFAKDAGTQQEAELLSIVKPFTKLAKGRSSGKKEQFALVKDVIKQGALEKETYSPSVLKARFPELNEASRDAYIAHQSFWEGVELTRSTILRRELDKGKYKTIGIGDEGFYGKVLPKLPELRQIADGSNSNKALSLKQESDNVIYGKEAYDKLKGTQFALTKESLEELYSSGGRVIKLNKPTTVEGVGDYMYIVARDLTQVQIRELPIFPAFGTKGYAGQRGYKDVYFKINRTNKGTKIDGNTLVYDAPIAVVGTMAEAKASLAYYQKANPKDSFAIERTRELNNLLDPTADASGVNAFMKKKGEQLEGSLGKDGLPTKATLFDDAVAIPLGARGSASDKLKMAEKINEARFTKQYGHFFKDIHQSGFPRTLSEDMWDVGKVKRAGLHDFLPQMMEDAKTLHYNISGMRAERLADGEKAFRRSIANLAKGMGANDNLAAQVASKAIMRTSQIHPSQMLRGVTSSMFIAWGITFQVPQNLLSAIGILTTQGNKGIHSISDSAWLLRGLMVRDTGDFPAAISNMAWKLGVSEELAEQFILRAGTSGVIGNAGEVDNLLSQVGKILQTEKTAWQKVKSPIATATGAVSEVVAQSIDATMLMFYSSAFRSVVDDFSKAKVGLVATGKPLGTDEFWELVRNRARKLSQNQNSSDLLAIEKSSSKVAFAGQFLQHLMKLGWEWTKVHGKAVGLKTESVYAKTEKGAGRLKSAKSAWKVLPVYWGIFGAGGYGENFMDMVHDELPLNIANPDTEAGKQLLAFIMGGLVDVNFQTLNYIMEGGDTSEDVLSVSSRVSPFGIANTVVDWVGTAIRAMSTGKLDIDALSTFFGASSSAAGNIVNSVKAVGSTISEGKYATREEYIHAVSELSYLFKSVGDAHLAYIMHQSGKYHGKQSGNILGSADGVAVIGKMFGFDTIGAIHQRLGDQKRYFSHVELDATAKATAKELKRLFNNTVSIDDDDSLNKFNEIKTRLLTALGSTLPEKYHDFVTQSIYKHTLQAISDDPIFERNLERSITQGIPIEEVLDDYMRNPKTTQEDIDTIMPLIEWLAKPTEGKNQ